MAESSHIEKSPILQQDCLSLVKRDHRSLHISALVTLLHELNEQNALVGGHL